MVVGEEGTSVEDFETYLKAEFLDAVYLQQNAFDPVDAATPPDRQRRMFDLVQYVLRSDFAFDGKDQARAFFYTLRQLFIDWNYIAAEAVEYEPQEHRIRRQIEEHSK
jgi:V/A-type H+-transporting ATPase subunit A